MSATRSATAAALVFKMRPLVELAERRGHTDVERAIRDEVAAGATDFVRTRAALQGITDARARLEMETLLEVAMFPHDARPKFTLSHDPFAGCFGERRRAVMKAAERVIADHGEWYAAVAVLESIDEDTRRAVLAHYAENHR
jgi:hypothetical protein